LRIRPRGRWLRDSRSAQACEPRPAEPDGPFRFWLAHGGRLFGLSNYFERQSKAVFLHFLVGVLQIYGNMRATVAYPVSAFSKTNWAPLSVSHSTFRFRQIDECETSANPVWRISTRCCSATARRYDSFVKSAMHHFAPLTPDARTALTSVLGCSGQRLGGGTRRRWNAAWSLFRR
jgi:hypothetical protein